MRIKPHAPVLYVAMAAAGLITLAVMGAYASLMRQDGRDGWIFYAFIAPFVLAGTLLTFSGGRAVLRTVRLGHWELDVPEGGGIIGRPLQATSFPRRTRTPSGEVSCHLRCIRVVSSAGKGRPSDRRTLWETTSTTRTGAIHPSIGQPLTLPLPLPNDGQPSAIDRRTGSGVLWQLDVVVPAAGGTDQAVFDLPVRGAP